MPKNIVICCDGTGNEFGGSNSNVVKLYQMLLANADQTVYYHPGIGTMAEPDWKSKLAQWFRIRWAQAFGAGLRESTGDAYAFLMENYEAGDQVFLFGFSRGAYTVRVLAALLHMFGLLRPGNEVQFRYLWRMAKHKLSRFDFDIADEFKATFSRECNAHFVGVWDTVSSVGYLWDPLSLPYTKNNPDVEVGRHAISIDERRCMFRQNLWGEPAGKQDLKQLWFAGVHSDVGGGYAEAEAGLAKIALQWMVDEAIGFGLKVDIGRYKAILGMDPNTTTVLEKTPKFIAPEPTATAHESLTFWWWLLEIFPHRHWDYRATPPRMTWGLPPMGSRRYIPPGSSLHPSVLQRIQRTGYAPANLEKNQ